MRVKRLEIQGFKSFKDKTIIHFDSGITGIVGPNGCGKSNIVDAFFWVMGEQSYKHMRGSSSDDLIFNGSSHYAPLGLAEVTLVLETFIVDTSQAPTGASVEDLPSPTQKKEISVTRRVYRSGEGEYFINGAPSRLKDIHELFMDTGVGAKGYSVIEQGQIGKVVNAKPEDRRVLIEEAAGIAKYKARKKESLRKIDSAQENLGRLNDVISEIERNLNSLDRQAQKARQYKKLKEELQLQEMTWGRRKYKILKSRENEISKEKETLEQEAILLKTQLQTTETELESNRILQLATSKQTEELQSQLQKLSDDLTHERSALELSVRRQEDLQFQLNSLITEKNDLVTTLSQENQKISGFETESNQAKTLLDDASAVVMNAYEQAQVVRNQVDEIRSKIDQQKRLLIQEVSEAGTLHSQAASLKAKAEVQRSQVQKMNEELSDNKVRLSQLHQETKALEEGIKNRASELEIKQNQKTELVKEKVILQTQRARLQSELDRVSKRVAEISAKHENLKELERTRAGFGDGAKSVLNWAQSENKSEAWSALADALEVNPGFETCVEAWLGDRLECLITTEKGDIFNAIRALRENQTGKAAIYSELASLRISSNSGSVDFVKALGYEPIGWLSDQVKIKSSYSENISLFIKTLLSQVVVVKSIAALPEQVVTSSSESDFVPMVSLDGVVIDASGMITAGSAPAESLSVLMMKRNISELEQSLHETQSTHESLKSEHTKILEELELTENKSVTLATEFSQLEIERASLVAERSAKQSSLQDLETKVEKLKIELELFERQCQDFETESENARLTADRLILKRTSSETEIQSLETDLQTILKELHLKEEAVQKSRLDEASLKERLSSISRELESLRGLMNERQRRVGEIERLVQRATQEKDQFHGGEKQMQATVETLVKSISELKATFSQTKDELEKITARMNEAMETIKRLHREGDDKNTRRSAIAVELERVISDCSHLIQSLEEKYGPGCLTQAPDRPEQENFEDPVVTLEMSEEEEKTLAENVEQLREKIRRLGEVNVMAVEEYEEVKKRHDHLVSEKSDLEKSIDDLNDAIDYINKTSEIRFQKAFEAIAERFERLFPIIFGGGLAKLSLVYPEGSTDILDAGVDVLAQPPGKKIANITLLSGGEKALTAISLIFAIFMVKPSPFCVLDEVDAPLDDANIGKFNALLREMSAKSQFILITHNKKTMELNDALYGVTMEEPGVSKMISIQLS